MLGERRIIFNVTFLLCISPRLLVYSISSSGISLGSNLLAEENNYWASSNGDFAIGFFNCSNEYSVGIRFVSSSIPVNEQTVVWVAGADIKVGNKSYFHLSQNGELVLFDSSTKEIAWTSQTSNASVASAILQDDGNLVLLNRKKDVVWQSFDTCTDTLLPGQNLSALQVLRPPTRNSVSSYYSLHMDISGQLQLRWEASVIYWTGGNPSFSAHRARLTTDGALQLLDLRSKSVWSIVGEDHGDSDVKFRFLRLDADGNLRLYSWQDASKSWRYVWQAVENQCDVFATCLHHGICVLNSSGSHFCNCPFAYGGESNSNCLVPYNENCESGSSIITYEHTYLYGIYPPNKTLVKTSLTQCKILCQEDQLCTAATFINDGTAQCQIMRTQYISGQSGPSLPSISFVKSCSDPIAVLPISPKSAEPSSQNSSLKSSVKICTPCLIGVAAGTVLIYFLIQFGVGLYLFRRRKYMRKKAALSYIDPSTRGCVMLSYPEICNLSENFKHQIGPKMFKGVLPDNRLVAIKKLCATIEERKLRIAVSKIGNIFHKNLLRLNGFCCDSGYRVLVYEFAKNGSLGNCLDDPKLSNRLTWKRRINICLGVSRAISYLHTECREFVSHGNLKCENVLLDDNLEAKVSEFGLGTYLEASDIGGMAESDVRDFGKMLVKLITGRQNVEDACEWAYEKWVAGQTECVADVRMEGEVNPVELERALRIAFWCLQVDERMRPSMGEVVKVLEGTLPVDPPPPLFPHCHFMPMQDEQPESDAEP